MTTPQEHKDEATDGHWEHSSHRAFFEYYRDESVSPQALERFTAIRKKLLDTLAADRGAEPRDLDVADVGCGAGTQCMLWAELGHRVNGIDINGPLIELARRRFAEANTPARFWVGSATELPWDDASMDVCIMPELLEHVVQWRQCLDEGARILRLGGILYLTTTNRLCPIQQEFNLPLYSWYPAPLKRYCENLARTTRPGLAGYATYPAVNWFTFHQLTAELKGRGLDAADRFETIDTTGFNLPKKLLISGIRRFALLRWLALAATPATHVIAIKRVG